MRWTVHGERTIYDSEWVCLTTVDVELPDGRRIDHHVVRVPHDAAATVVHDPERGILMMWRHRFITDAWGWEVPAGRVDPGETPAECAGREAEEETGWRPSGVELMATYHPTDGLSDQTFHVFRAEGATHTGPPTDITEADRIEWLPIEQVRRLIRGGEVRDGISLTALTLWLLDHDPAR